MKTKTNQKPETLHLDNNYTHFLNDIKNRLKTVQIRAALAVNSELIKFYWELGRDLIEKQKAYKWGEQFLEQFSQDMLQAFPEMQGFSLTNLKKNANLHKGIPRLRKKSTGCGPITLGTYWCTFTPS